MFNFTNVADKEITIAVAASCGCTVPTMEKTTYKPGESGKVSARFDPHSRQGPQTKTLTFTIRRTAGPTLVDIQDQGSPSDVIINGTINNPVGITRIYAAHGDILSTHARGVAGSDGRFALIITNVIDLQAPNGSVGKLPRINVDIVYSAIAPAPVIFKTSQVSGPLDTIFAGPSQLFDGALVKYTTEGAAIGGLTPGAKYTAILDGITIQLAVPGSTTPIDLDPTTSAMATRHFLTPQLPFTALAGTDVYLDVKGRFRDPAMTTYTVIVDNVRAGH